METFHINQMLNV